MQVFTLILVILICETSVKHLINTFLKEIHCTLLLPQKQPLEVFCKKQRFFKICKIHKKTPVLESLLNKVAGAQCFYFQISNKIPAKCQTTMNSYCYQVLSWFFLGLLKALRNLDSFWWLAHEYLPTVLFKLKSFRIGRVPRFHSLQSFFL